MCVEGKGVVKGRGKGSSEEREGKKARGVCKSKRRKRAEEGEKKKKKT